MVLGCREEESEGGGKSSASSSSISLSFANSGCNDLESEPTKLEEDDPPDELALELEEDAEGMESNPEPGPTESTAPLDRGSGVRGGVRRGTFGLPRC